MIQPLMFEILDDDGDLKSHDVIGRVETTLGFIIG
jgi:hypothetical protein